MVFLLTFYYVIIVILCVGSQGNFGPSNAVSQSAEVSVSSVSISPRSFPLFWKSFRATPCLFRICIRLQPHTHSYIYINTNLRIGVDPNYWSCLSGRREVMDTNT